MEATCSCPADCSLGLFDGGGEDRISFLVDSLLPNVISRLPAKEAVSTTALSPRWRCVWPSTPLVLDDTDLLADGSLALLYGGNEDRISCLADSLLSEVISRLPAKDAARTAVLSMRWRCVWASTPLVLDDTDLLPDLPDDGVPTDWRAITDAVSRVLTAHPGPFRSVRLIHAFNYAAIHDGGALARSWLRVLAEKGVQDLVLFNWDNNAGLPADVLRVASLIRLELGLLDFPNTKDIRRDEDVFPGLLELKLCRTDIGTTDIGRLLVYSPKLEKLALVDSDNSPPSIRVRSLSLRCLLFWKSIADELDVVVAQSLDRFIIWSECPGARLPDDFRTRLNIGYAPALKVLGYLDPGIHVLEIFNTVIEAGTEPSRRTFVPSVKILGLKVRFGVLKEVKMLPSYLRCFPNVQTLHIMSDKADEATGKLDFKFWKEERAIRCLWSRIKRVVLKNFGGNRSELAFLRFVWERAKLLETMVFVLADGDDPALMESVVTKLKSLGCVKLASETRTVKILVRNGGGDLRFEVASDLSVGDPFDS